MYIYVYMYICIYIHINIYIHTYTYAVYIYIYIYTYIHTYIHTHTHTQSCLCVPLYQNTKIGTHSNEERQKSQTNLFVCLKNGGMCQILCSHVHACTHAFFFNREKRRRCHAYQGSPQAKRQVCVCAYSCMYVIYGYVCIHAHVYVHSQLG